MYRGTAWVVKRGIMPSTVQGTFATITVMTTSMLCLTKNDIFLQVQRVMHAA